MSGVLQALLAGFGGAATDEYFEYVTMLLPGNGTNGAQNNTFLDSSTNNFSITRNGNTTQGTFTPYGSNWSNYFDGTGDYLSVADSASLELGGSDFCIEGWYFPQSFGSNLTLVGKRANTTSTGAVVIYANSGSGALTFYASANGSSYFWSGSTIGTMVLNQWNHFAVYRSGNNWYGSMNGVVSSMGSSANSIVNNTDAYTIGGDTNGNYANGYISNTRIVIGSAVYGASNFTPPTSPLTAITNTQLLTCQSNRFIDNSSNNFTITRNGDVSIQRFSPFNPTAPYSTSVIGGSGYFDGSGDTLTTSTSQIIPTGSFTVECWAYVTGASSNQKFVAQGSSGAAGRFSVGIEGGNWFTQLAGDLIQTGTPVRNQWNYVAVTYNGSTITMYVNGSSIGTVSSSANAQNTTLTIGQDWNSYITTGYIADVRISNTVRTITTPTAPYSSDGSTRLLLSMTNGGIVDNAMMNDLETVGNAQISTSVSKFGGGSIAFDGTGDYLVGPYSPQIDFGSGDFTVECWLYRTASGAAADSEIASAGNPTTLNGWHFGYTSSNTLFFGLNYSGYLVTSTGTISVNTWTHVAVTRSGTSFKLFINGTQDGSATSSGTPTLSTTSKIYVGSGSYDPGASNRSVTGYIDDLRITKGYARYTANFTAPTAAFPLS